MPHKLATLKMPKDAIIEDFPIKVEISIEEVFNNLKCFFGLMCAVFQISLEKIENIKYIA